MYGKFFASTFSGSMMASGPEVFAVWGYVIANTVDSVVELNPRLLAAVIGSTPERMQEAIDVLCAPDQSSRSQVMDGCRLVRQGQFQYHVTNHAIYRAMRNEDDRREYNRLAKQRERARKRAKEAGVKGRHIGVTPPVIDLQRLSNMSAQAEAEEEKRNLPSVGKEKPHAADAAQPATASRGTVIPTDWSPGDEGKAYAATKGLRGFALEQEVEGFRDYWTAVAGANGRKRDWPATWRTWVRRSMERKQAKQHGASDLFAKSL